jgi:polyphosphate glucokinase
VRKLIDGLRPVFVWDRLYLGGGNARMIKSEIVEKLGDDVVIVPNSAALVGGVRAWQVVDSRD